MIELDNRTDIKLDAQRLEKIAAGVTKLDIELIITDNEEMRALNSEYRRIDRATDVLSFPCESMPMAPLGSIVISADYITSGAEEFSHTPDDEAALLFIHGLLHLLGYDHECDSGEMRQKEKELIERFSLPSSLIVRTEG